MRLSLFGIVRLRFFSDVNTIRLRSIFGVSLAFFRYIICFQDIFNFYKTVMKLMRFAFRYFRIEHNRIFIILIKFLEI